MSSTSIDYLTQLAPPRTENAGGLSRSRDVGPPFDCHFQQATGASTTAGPPPARTAAENRDNDRRSQSDAKSSSAPPAASQSRPADQTRKPNEGSTAEDRDDEASPTEEAAVAAVPLPAEQAKQKQTTADTAGEETQPIDEATKVLPKQNRKSAAATQLALANEATADAAATSPESDSAAEPIVTATATADADDAEGESTKQALAKQAIDGVDTKQIATDEPDGDGVAEKSANAGRTRNGRGEAAKSGLDPESTSAADASRSPKNADTKSAEGPATVIAASATASKQSQDVQTGSSTGTKSDKASAKNKLTNDEKQPGSHQTTDDLVGSQTSAGTAARGAGVPSEPVAAAVAPTATAHDATSASTSGDSAAQPKKVGAAAKEGVLATFARFDRGGLLGGRGAQRAGEAQDGPHVDPARFVSRVARAIQTAHERGTPLLLRLSPPELGSLRLELSVQQGALSATVEADNQNARQMLLDNLPALRDRLADQNIRIERFDVDVRRDGEGGQQPNTNAEQQQEQQQGGTSHSAAARRGMAVNATVDSAPIDQTTITNTSINVVA